MPQINKALKDKEEKYHFFIDHSNYKKVLNSSNEEWKNNSATDMA